MLVAVTETLTRAYLDTFVEVVKSV